MKLVRPMAVAEGGAFARASAASYFDVEGVLRTAAADVHRLSYDPGDLARPPEYLIEPAATNLLLRSAEFSDAAWSKGFGASVTADLAVGPDGAFSADRIESTTINSDVNQTIILGEQGPFTFSVFLLAGSAKRVRLREQQNAINADVDLVTGEVEGSGFAERCAGGWWRVTLAFEHQMLGVTVTIRNASGVATGDFYAWGAQLERGERPSSYIPTTSAAADRAADVITSTFLTTVAEDEPQWDSGTAYAAGDQVRGPAGFEHTVYESLQGSNTGNDPSTDDGTNWVEVGPTNRWKMFDPVVQTQTEALDVIACRVLATGRVDTVALQNVSALSARVRVWDPIDGELYDETRSLISTTGIDDWWPYFFEPVERIRDLTFADLPLYANPGIDISLAEPGGTVKCGLAVLGLSAQLGGTKWNANVGILDYSSKSTDEFGRMSVVERAYSKRGGFQVIVPNSRLDMVVRLLADYRATPVLFVADDRYGALQIYGYPKSWGVDVAYPDISILGIDLEGLT